MLRALLTALVVLWPSLAAAAGITATLDPSTVAVGERAVLVVTIDGARNARPTLPRLPDFDVFEAGTSSQITFVNGRQSMSLASTYVLVPRRAGEFSIGEITVDVGGKTFAANPLQLTVTSAPTATEPAPSADTSRELFLVASVDDDTPFVGQQVIYTLKLYRAVPLASANLDLDGFDDVVVEDLGDQRDYEATYQGRRYQVTEIRKALFPQKPGQMTLPTATVTADVVNQQRGRSRFGNPVFDDFFGRSRTERRTVRASEIALKVSRTPPAPDGYAGMIGEFSLTGELSRDTLKVGESTTLTLVVSGGGSAMLLPEPTMGDLSDFKVYDDKPEGGVERRWEGLRGTRTFTRALVPLKAGELTVPEARLVVLDPKSGKFKTSRVGPFTLHVAPGEGGEDLRLTEGLGPAGKVAVKVVGDDILPLVRDVAAVHPSGPPAPLLAGGLVIPPLLAAGAAAAAWRRRRYATDDGLYRRERALKTARAAAAAVRDASTPADAATAASRALRGYIGDKLGAEGGALTPDEAGELLRSAGVDDSLLERVVVRLREAEAVQYGAPGTADATSLADDVGALLTDLDAALRRAK